MTRPYAISCLGGKTKQADKDDCDINILMARYVKTGNLDHIAKHLPQYGDFSNVTDYHTALNQVLDAQELFDALPSAIRSRMDNSPVVLLEFMSDANNLDEARQLGLVNTDPTAIPDNPDSLPSNPGSQPSAGPPSGAAPEGAPTGP